ncbi:MAG: DUF3137 domain-containing protein [Clostridiales bacterium]|nr:DUF3137 domain-containing protein [Clostridiales bacterium]
MKHDPQAPQQPGVSDAGGFETGLFELIKTERKFKNLMTVFAVLSFLLIVLLFVVLFTYPDASDRPPFVPGLQATFGISLAVSAVLLFVFLKKSASAGEKAKQLASDNIIRAVLEDRFELSAYDPTGHIAENQVNVSGLVEAWNTISGSNHVEGKYKGAGFSFSEIILTDRGEGSDDKTNRRFNGQWLVFEMNKELPSPLLLRERVGIGKLAKSNVETQNTAFNKKFRILAQDPQMASYVLTPQFMDFLLGMGQKGGVVLYAGFVGHQCHIALHSDWKLFNMNAVKTRGGDYAGLLRARIEQDVQFMTGIMDGLLSHRHLFGGENQGS